MKIVLKKIQNVRKKANFKVKMPNLKKRCKFLSKDADLK